MLIKHLSRFLWTCRFNVPQNQRNFKQHHKMKTYKQDTMFVKHIEASTAIHWHVEVAARDAIFRSRSS
eukprot:6033340-Pleurochrysis_carterae.AAC.4